MPINTVENPKRRPKTRSIGWASILKIFGSFLISSSLVGTAITEVSSYRQAQVAEHQKAVTMATSVFFDLIDTCNKRSFYARRAAAGLADSDISPDEALKRWNQYDLMVIYWNENRLRNAALLKRYFGKEFLSYMLRELVTNHGFGEVHTDLYMLKRCPSDKVLYKALIEKIDKLDDKISIFSDNLQSKLQNHKDIN